MSPDGLTLICTGDDPRLSLRQLPPRSHEIETDWTVLFEDDFERHELSDNWKIINGNWTIESGVAHGALGRETGNSSAYAATIAARSTLPENVEVSYDLRSALKSASRPSWSVALSKSGSSRRMSAVPGCFITEARRDSPC